MFGTCKGTIQFFIIYIKKKDKYYVEGRRRELSNILTDHISSHIEEKDIRCKLRVTKDDIIETENIKIHRVTLYLRDREEPTKDIIETHINNHRYFGNIFEENYSEMVKYVNGRRKFENL